MKLESGQTLKHPCGLVYRNVTKKTLEFAQGQCPQCHAPVQPMHITGGPPDIVTWTLIPPPGMAFKNSMGSEVTISFPRGQETELFQALQHQLNSYFRATLPGGGGIAQGHVRATRGPIRVPKMHVNEDGEIIVSDEEDEVGSAAANVMRNTARGPTTSNPNAPPIHLNLPNGPDSGEDTKE